MKLMNHFNTQKKRNLLDLNRKMGQQRRYLIIYCSIIICFTTIFKSNVQNLELSNTIGNIAKS